VISNGNKYRTTESAQEAKLQAGFIDNPVLFFVRRWQLLRLSNDSKLQPQRADQRRLRSRILRLFAGLSGFGFVARGQSNPPSSQASGEHTMTERKRLRIVPILITMAATLILSVGSFYGCGRTFNMSGGSALNTFFFYSFVVCAMAFLASLAWLVVTIVINFLRRRTEGQ
jgi:hypothetical protein